MAREWDARDWSAVPVAGESTAKESFLLHMRRGNKYEEEDVRRTMMYLQFGGELKDTAAETVLAAQNATGVVPEPTPETMSQRAEQKLVSRWYGRPPEGRRTKGMLLAWPTGKGKTFASIFAYLAALKHNPNLRFYVTCLKSVTGHWTRALSDFQRLFCVYFPNRWYVRTHVMFIRDYYLRRDQMSDVFLVVDEAHKFHTFVPEKWQYQPLAQERVSPESVELNQAARLVRIAYECPWVTLLTASERRNRVSDSNNLMAMLYGRERPWTVKAYEAWSSNLNHFECVFRLQLDPETDPSYPRVVERDVWLPLSGACLRHYLAVQARLIAEYNRPEVFLTGFRQAQQENMDAVGGMVYAAEQIKQNYAAGEKTLFCTEFTSKVLNYFAVMVRELGVPFVKVDGKTTKRNELFARANQPNLDVGAILVSKAAGTGVDLNNARVRRVIVLGSAWTHETILQWIGRVRRLHALDAYPVEERVIDVQIIRMDLPERIVDYTASVNTLEAEFHVDTATAMRWCRAETEGPPQARIQARREMCRLMGPEQAAEYVTAKAICQLWIPRKKSADRMMYEIASDKQEVLQDRLEREKDYVYSDDMDVCEIFPEQKE